MNISRRYFGDIFTIFVLTLATGAFQSLIVDTSSAKAVTEGNGLLQFVWAVVYVIVAIRAARQYREIADAVRANKFLIALVMLAAVSMLWSADPGLTLRRGVALLGTTLFGLDFAVRYSIREQLRLLAIALGGMVVLSVLFQIFLPGQIPTTDMVYPDAWVGLFVQKNDFGRVIVLTTLVIISAVRKTAAGKITAILAVVAAFGLIFAAESMTAFVTLVGMIAIMQVLPTIRWNSRVRTLVQGLIAVVAVPALYLIVQYRGAVTELLGRNSSLTGRVKIWALSVASIAVQPILGYGYNAFWNVSPVAMRIDATLNWNVPHAHNAYIELALELGLLGLFLYGATFLVAMKRAITYMRANSENSAKWPLVYLCFVLLYSFTENSMLSPNTILWMLFVAAACSVSQPAYEEAEEFADESGTDSDPEPSFATN